MKITSRPGNWEENASSKIRKIDVERENTQAPTMEDEEDENDDGPPPGFHLIIGAPLLQAPKANASEPLEEGEVDMNEAVQEGEVDASAEEEDTSETAPEEEDEDDDEEEEDEEVEEDSEDEEEENEVEEEEEEEGPPPGFHSIAPKPSQPLPRADMASSEEEHGDDDDDDVDGPPPGWEFNIPVNALPKSSSQSTDERMESDEDLDEGPPPGWETVLPNQMAPPHIPPLQPPSTLTSCLEIESKLKITTAGSIVPPPLSEFTATPTTPDTPPLEHPPSKELHCDPESKEDGKNDGDRREISEDQLISPQQQPPRSPDPSISYGPSFSEKAQLVCGTCRKLCLYPLGTKLVQCPTCKEVNFVLEAHEVGQVNCGGCPILLMYPYGAPAVQCSSCRFVTQIGEHNKRPPLSAQLAQKQRRRCNGAP